MDGWQIERRRGGFDVRGIISPPPAAMILGGIGGEVQRRMLYWAQLLHFYQPSNQTYAILARICEESYRPLLDVFEAQPHIRATFNINGVLLDLFHEHGFRDVIERLRALVERGQIELTGTGKYHPILPLLPPEEQARQIALDAETKRRYFGPGQRARGFFPPEMAYDRSILAPISRSGHEWLILSGVANPVLWPTRRVDRIPADPGPSAGAASLAVFYRDDILSNKISFRSVEAGGFLAHLEALTPAHGDAYVVTAMDAETYGHHIQAWDRLFLAQVYSGIAPARAGDGPTEPPRAGRAVAAVMVSQLLDRFPAGESVEPRPSSWSTSDADIEQARPFPLWLAPDNEVHHLQWEHLALAIDLVKAAERLADTPESHRFAGLARRALDRGEQSCQMWWASRRPMWETTMIEQGLILQGKAVVNAYRAIDASNAAVAQKRAHYRQLVLARHLRDRIVDHFFATRL